MPSGLAASAIPISTDGCRPAKCVNPSAAPPTKIGARIGYGIETPTVLIKPSRQTAARIQYGWRTVVGGVSGSVAGMRPLSTSS